MAQETRVAYGEELAKLIKENKMNNTIDRHKRILVIVAG